MIELFLLFQIDQNLLCIKRFLIKKAIEKLIVKKENFLVAKQI
jgi:hypothetical protein